MRQRGAGGLLRTLSRRFSTYRAPRKEARAGARRAGRAASPSPREASTSLFGVWGVPAQSDEPRRCLCSSVCRRDPAQELQGAEESAVEEGQQQKQWKEKGVLMSSPSTCRTPPTQADAPEVSEPKMHGNSRKAREEQLQNTFNVAGKIQPRTLASHTVPYTKPSPTRTACAASIPQQGARASSCRCLPVLSRRPGPAPSPIQVSGAYGR